MPTVCYVLQRRLSVAVTHTLAMQGVATVYFVMDSLWMAKPCLHVGVPVAQQRSITQLSDQSSDDGKYVVFMAEQKYQIFDIVMLTLASFPGPRGGGGGGGGGREKGLVSTVCTCA